MISSSYLPKPKDHRGVSLGITKMSVCVRCDEEVRFRYKERLRTKVIKTKEAIPVDSSEWRFIGDGGEDFRTGVPLRDGTKIIQRSQVGCYAVCM